MRAREFIMKDAYSFDATDEAATESYNKMKRAYTAFFLRCGLKTIAVEADTGVMGGSFSHEFMVPAPVGDDDIVYNDESGYSANREKATSGIVPKDLADAAPAGALEEFATPGIVTIAALAAAPYSVPADKQFKTLVYMGDGKPFLVILRGCDDLEEREARRAGLSRSASGHAGRDRAGHGREARQPRRRQGHDQRPAGSRRRLCRPRDQARRQRHDRRQQGWIPHPERERRPRP